MHLVDELDSLVEDGPHASRFKTELYSIVRELREDFGRSPEQIRTEIGDSGRDHPLVNFITGLSKWVETSDYHDGAEPALEDLREAVDLAIVEDWNDLLPILIVQRIKLLSTLSHRTELKAEVILGIYLLEEKGDSLAVGPVFDVLDTAINNLESISGTESVEYLLDYIEKHAGKAIVAEDYRNHRNLWRRSLETRKSEDLETDAAEQAIIDSYSDEIHSLKSNEEHGIRASVARDAIRECNEWIGEPQRVEWEHEFIEGNKLSIEQMIEFSHEPSEEEVENLEEMVEHYVEGFKEQKEERHAVYAIKWLLNQDIFVPDVENVRESAGGSIMGQIFPATTISEAGESYSQDEGRMDLPHSYGVAVQFTHNISQRVYYHLQNRELIKEGHLFILFNRIDVLPADALAYLSDFIVHLFEHNHSAAVHLGMTQLEAVIRVLARDNGKSTLSLDEETGELGRRALGSLLYQIEGEVDESWIAYLRYRYVDLAGQNIRNKIAHGYLSYNQAAWGMSIILLFDILRSFLEFEQAYDTFY